MIDWTDIDSRLAALGKDRAWLTSVSGYSEASVREALAPNSKKRSARMQKSLTRAIEDEEAARQQSREVKPGVFEIFQTEAQLDLADRASRIVNAPSLADYCRDVILTESNRLLGIRNQKDEMK